MLIMAAIAIRELFALPAATEHALKQLKNRVVNISIAWPYIVDACQTLSPMSSMSMVSTTLGSFFLTFWLTWQSTLAKPGTLRSFS
jgi:hypothetical protein